MQIPTYDCEMTGDEETGGVSFAYAENTRVLSNFEKFASSINNIIGNETSDGTYSDFTPYLTSSNNVKMRLFSEDQKDVSEMLEHMETHDTSINETTHYEFNGTYESPDTSYRFKKRRNMKNKTKK